MSPFKIRRMTSDNEEWHTEMPKEDLSNDSSGPADGTLDNIDESSNEIEEYRVHNVIDDVREDEIDNDDESSDSFLDETNDELKLSRPSSSMSSSGIQQKLSANIVNRHPPMSVSVVAKRSNFVSSTLGISAVPSLTLSVSRQLADDANIVAGEMNQVEELEEGELEEGEVLMPICDEDEEDDVDDEEMIPQGEIEEGEIELGEVVLGVVEEMSPETKIVTRKNRNENRFKNSIKRLHCKKCNYVTISMPKMNKHKQAHLGRFVDLLIIFILSV